jgi:hypothetical protein
MRRLHRGDLSAPVLAIIVTIGVIAAGLVLMAWFWWFAPQAGKAGVLQILGTPSIDKETIAGTEYWVAYISVKNTGNEPVTINGVTVKGVSMNKYGTGWILLPDGSYTDALDPGKSGIIKAKADTTMLTIGDTEYTVSGIIYTSYGTFAVSLSVVR